MLSRSVEAAAPYRIEVKPGDATVPKGADQAIAATLSGFDAADAAVVFKKGAESSYERVAMLKGEDGSYEGLLFDLSDNLEYFVEAAGVRSPVFTLKVVELPYVKKLDLEYRFPSYTGLEPRKVEDGGDIAVLAGTDVALTITPTMASKGGRVVIGDSDSVALGRGRGRHADGVVHGQDRRLLPHRARRAERRARDRLAAVHHRHPQRPDADGGRLEAGTRHRRDAGPGVRRRGEGRR